MSTLREKALSRWSLVLYAFADLGGGITDFPIAIFLIPFYTEVMGLGPSVVGWVVLATGLYDIITDPLMGVITDRTRTRWGRRRIYFLVGALPLGLSFWWMFSPVGSNATMSFLLAYIVFYTAMDFVFIPHYAMSAELTPDYDGRTRVQGYNRSFWIIGLLLGVIIPILMEGAFPEKRTTFHYIGLIMGGLMTLTVLVTFFGTKENPAFWRDVHVSLVDGIRAIAKNRNFLLLALCNFVYSAGCAIPNTLLLYYAKHYLKVEEAKVLAAVPIYLVASIASVPVWVYCSRKLQKKAAYMLAFITAAIGGFASLIIQPGQVIPLYVIFAIAGAGYGGLMAVPGSMVSDVIDIDEYETAERREGIYFGVWEFFRKTSHNIAIWMVLQLLSLIGYVQQAQQTPEVENYIRLMFAIMPGVVYLAGVVLMFFYTHNRDSVSAVQEKLRQKGLPV